MNQYTFQTTDGKKHSLDLNFAIVRELDRWDFTSVSPNGFRLLTDGFAGDGAEIERLYHDFGLISAMVFAILWIRRKHAGELPPETSQEEAEIQFLSTVDGAVLEPMRVAFWEALMDFFPSVRRDLKRVQIVANEARNVLQAEADLLDEESAVATRQNTRKMIQQAKKEMWKQVGGLSGESVDSLDGVGQTSGK